MVQTCDRPSVASADSDVDGWVEPAVNFTFSGGEQAQSGTRVWLLLPGTDTEQFSVHEAATILFGLDIIWGVGLVVGASLSQCCSTRLQRRIPMTVMPYGHLAILLLHPGFVETDSKTSCVRDARGRISIKIRTALPRRSTIAASSG